MAESPATPAPITMTSHEGVEPAAVINSNLGKTSNHRLHLGNMDPQILDPMSPTKGWAQTDATAQANGVYSVIKNIYSLPTTVLRVAERVKGIKSASNVHRTRTHSSCHGATPRNKSHDADNLNGLC